MTDETLLTPEDVARRLQMDAQTIRKWLRKGLLPGVRFTREWRVRPADLEKFIQEREAKP